MSFRDHRRNMDRLIPTRDQATVEIVSSPGERAPKKASIEVLSARKVVVIHWMQSTSTIWRMPKWSQASAMRNYWTGSTSNCRKFWLKYSYAPILLSNRIKESLGNLALPEMRLTPLYRSSQIMFDKLNNFFENNDLENPSIPSHPIPSIQNPSYPISSTYTQLELHKQLSQYEL